MNTEELRRANEITDCIAWCKDRLDKLTWVSSIWLTKEDGASGLQISIYDMAENEKVAFLKFKDVCKERVIARIEELETELFKI